MRRTFGLTIISWAVVMCCALFVVLPAFAQSGEGDGGIDAQVSSMMSQAYDLAKQNDYTQAISIFESVLSQFPDHPRAAEAAMGAARCRDKLGDRDASIDAYRRVFELYPESEYAPAAKKSVALHFLAKKEYDTAIQEFSELVQQYPNSADAPDALLSIGHIYETERDQTKVREEILKLRDQADAAFRKVTETFPDKGDKCAEAELYRGDIALQNARSKRITWDAARAQIQAALDTYPNAPAWIRARCEIMLAEERGMQSDNAGCAAGMEAVISKYPNCRLEVGWAHYAAGSSCELIGQYQRALDHYNAVINGNYTKTENFKGRDITLYSLLRAAQTYTKLGQAENARRMWNTLITRYPNDPVTQKARAELQKLGG